MSAKKIQSIPALSEVRLFPRYNRTIVLDDSKMDLYIHTTLLTFANFAKKIFLETSADNVLSYLRTAKRLDEIPEIIFLDLKMKSMTGFDFLESFSKLSDFVRDKCKIVVVTSSEDKEDKQRALQYESVVHYLRKPIDIHHITSFLQH
jgi:CheY-like chemotaxis protein